MKKKGKTRKYHSLIDLSSYSSYVITVIYDARISDDVPFKTIAKEKKAIGYRKSAKMYGTKIYTRYLH